MTKYAFELTVSESEVFMLEKALQLMIDTCEDNIANVENALNNSHKDSAENVLARLYSNPYQISGNNFHK